MSLEHAVTQIMEADIFKPAGKKELADREAARTAASKAKVAAFLAKHTDPNEWVRTFTIGHCPVCDSENLDYHGDEREDDSMWYEFTCEDCGTDGNEVYDVNYSHTEVSNLSGQNESVKEAEEPVFKPASAEEAGKRLGNRYVIELIAHAPFVAIHPLGVVTDDAAQEAAERLSTSDSSWMVIDDAALDNLRAVLDRVKK